MADLPPPVPPVSIEPPALLPPRDPNDKFVLGCAMGCGMTIAFGALSFLLALAADSSGHGKLSNYMFASWGVTQWIGIIPLILNDRKKGRKNRVMGMIVAGCLGLLLSSACAELVFNLGNMH